MTPTAIPFKKLILIAGDVAVFAAAIMASPFIRNLGAPEAGIIELYRLAAPFLAALWLVGFVMFGLYDLKAAKNGPPFFEALARALLFNFAVTVFLFYLIPEFRLRPLVTLLIIFAVLGLAIAAWRAGYNAVLARMAKERVLFLGAGEDVRELAEFLVEHPQLGFAPVAFVANGNGETGQTEKLNLPAPVISAEGKLADLVRTHAASMIVVAHDIKRNRAFLKNIFPVVPLGVTITDFSHFYELVRGKIPVSLIGEAWFLENLIGAKRPKYELAKRILDLLTATALGAIALLLLAPIAVAIALSTPGDILRYRKLRAHRGGGGACKIWNAAGRGNGRKGADERKILGGAGRNRGNTRRHEDNKGARIPPEGAGRETSAGEAGDSGRNRRVPRPEGCRPHQAAARR